MKKIAILLICLIASLFANTHLEKRKEKSVLILNSYHSGYEWSDTIINNIQKVFDENLDIDINILYMDSKRVTSKEYFETLKNLYSIQLKNRKYDLVIAVDRFAYDFLLENYSRFFKDEKILGVGLEKFSKQKARKYNVEDKTSALLERRAIADNIALISEIYPKLEKLYIINDSSPNGDHTHPFIMEAIKKVYNRFEIEYIRKSTKKELEKRFAYTKKNEAMLFIRFYKNKYDELLLNKVISNTIKNLNIPVFVTDSLFIDSNILGGRIVLLDRFGYEAGRMAVDILKYNAKPLVKIDQNFRYVFDYNSLKKYTVSIPNSVNDFKIINSPLSYFDKNRKFVDGVFLFTPVLVLLIMGLIHNIYFRRKSERSLKNRIKFDQVLLNSLDNPIFWQNPEGKIIDANEHFCKLIEVPYEKFYRKKLSDIDALGRVEFLMGILSNYENKSLEDNSFEYIDKLGNKKIYLIKQSEYKVDRKSTLINKVTKFIDLTKEKKEQMEKNRAQQFIIQQSKLAEIGEVFSSIAHQWKSPLVNITAIAQDFFYTHKDKRNEEDNEHLEEIMKQVHYMTNTMSEFQNFILPSKKKSDFDVYKSIKAILDIVNHSIKYNYIKISFDVQEDANLIVNGYKNEFMQCFLNIINNAKDALNSKKIKDKKIHVKIFNKKNWVYIEVQDNAGGIEEELLNKIFMPYYTTKKDGHGIGLHMCKVIIEDKMGGEISVENRDEGACFLISLQMDGK